MDLSKRKMNLSGPLTPLLGRARQVEELIQLLQRPNVTLVTMTGPGGVGKTRLALAILDQLADMYMDGVAFVSLAALTDPTLVLPTIAQWLGVRELGDTPPLTLLRDYLRDKQMLLLLDNFEQVLDAAPVLVELIAGCATLQILVTSRASLHVRGEYQYALVPLALPDAYSKVTLEAIRASPAIELFVERAQAIDSSFRLTAENAERIAGICARLDGLPLALELAAARIKLLSPQAMVARLDHPLQWLTDGARDLPPRQRTLRDTIAWSYMLLHPDEQRAFRALSVLHGGGTLEVAEKIVAAPNTLDVLQTLLDQNMVRMQDERVEMLETLRAFAHEQLRTNGEQEKMERLHNAHFLEFAENAERHLITPEQGIWLERIERDHDNLRAALEESIERGDTEMGLRLSGALWLFWLTRGFVGEGRRWLEQALALADADRSLDAPRAKAELGAGTLAFFQADYVRAETHLQRSAHLFEAVNDARGASSALNLCALALGFYGTLREAQTIAATSVALIEPLGDAYAHANALFYQAFVAWLNDQAGTGYKHIHEALGQFRAFGDARMIAFCLFGLGFCASALQRTQEAHDAFQEAVVLLERLHDRRSVTMCLNGLSQLALARGEYASAHKMSQEALAILNDLGDHWYIALSLESLGGVAAKLGDAVRAARLFGAAHATREMIHAPLPAPWRPAVEKNIATAQARLDAQTWARAWEEGLRLNPAQALEQVMQLRVVEKSSPQVSTTDTLTSRELDVLKLLAQGLTDAQIAAQLVISTRTVHAHTASIYSKIRVNSRAAATRYALDHKMA